MSESPRHTFDHLVESAAAVPITGWDFSYLRDRTGGGDLPWDYCPLAQSLVTGAHRVLDVDTGGGEFFSALCPPEGSVAIEPHRPNVEVAQRRLRPLGVEVVERHDESLPVPDQAFDLVLNRHGHLEAAESHRVLAPGGRLLSQQVGARNDVELNEALGVPPAPPIGAATSIEDLRTDLAAAGLDEVEVREAIVVTRFFDVGAVVFQLRAVPWQVPDFDVTRHREGLARIHEQVQNTGAFEVRSQRFLIRARRVD
ncbi:class I SAM-dependent methyltransferase [Occultella aeris]|uniref:Methyltransferase type 11 domain-containing protein n=1 Tax=Occultella aeris TaxID=2761496 RepID=A0A7M4DIX3_9MICO|nr:class I SAM-dependent methyltransferase [Occultella aeris]VZO36940.1 hypothetical protein HALOF300_02076 [Occultella aeris]